MAPGGGKRKEVHQSASNVAKNDSRRSGKDKRMLTTDDTVTGGPSNSKRQRTAAPETFEPPLQAVAPLSTEDHDISGASSSTSSADRSLGPTSLARMGMLKDQDMAMQRGGFFQYARNLAVNNSTMVDVGMQNVFVQSSHSREALDWLEKYIMPGAEFDSSERDPPPHCHPGTRTTIIERVQQWLTNHEREKNLLWLHGPAGVGKSAIVQTLVEAESEAARLGASLFFSRPNGRTNPKQVFPTIAYQLAVRDHSYRTYIGELMARDPRSLDKAMGEQFRTLIVEPFTRRHICRGLEAWLVALDGLDECGGEISEYKSCHTQPAGRHSDRSQREIVRLIGNFVLRYPMIPLIWIIASRPEPHLKVVFSDDSIRACLWEEEVPIDSEEACRDVEKFLHSEFSRISKDYPEHITGSVWPSNDNFLKIAKASSGLFAFADVVTRFIDDPWVGNPIAQLDIVLSALSKLAISPDQRNPFAALDKIYTEILSKIPPDMLQAAKKLVGTCIFFERRQISVRKCSFWCMCNVLDITKDIAVTALRHLHSVLRMPQVKDIATSRPRFYHASFRDYLEDPSRSRDFWIEVEITTIDFFWGVFRFSQAIAFHEAQSDAVELNSAARDFYGVPLSWSVEGQNSDIISLHELALDAFRELMYSEASPSGFKLRYYHTNIFIDENRFWEILAAVRVRSVMDGTRSTINATRFGEPIVKMVDRCATECEQRGFLTRTTLGSLGIDPNLDERSIKISCVYNRYVYVQLDKKPYPGRSSAEIAAYQTLLSCLSHRVKVAPQTEIRIIGFKDSWPVAVYEILPHPLDAGRYTFYIMGF